MFIFLIIFPIRSKLNFLNINLKNFKIKLKIYNLVLHIIYKKWLPKNKISQNYLKFISISKRQFMYREMVLWKPAQD